MDEVNFLSSVPTVKVKNRKKNPRTKYLIINESDFDPDLHECIDEFDQKRMLVQANQSGAKSRARKLRAKKVIEVEVDEILIENVDESDFESVEAYLNQPGMTVKKIKNFAEKYEIELTETTKANIVLEIINYIKEEDE